MVAAYNARRVRDLKRTYPDGTLGALIQWFEHECPEFENLAEATKKDYRAAFAYLRPEFDAPLSTITQPALYEVRDRCAKDKWPRFADKMLSAISAMFTRAVKRGKMPANPAIGIDRLHKADPNANREWSSAEWLDAIRQAPAEIKTPMMLARFAGFRGQTIAALQWKNYQTDPRYGKCFRVQIRKNKEAMWIPVVPELQAYLDGLTRTSMNIATRDNGTVWDDEKQMQTAVSHFLRSIQDTSAVEPGATLHGLRVSYAADLGRDGVSDGDVAAALGDRSERMGKHYTRHVEKEAKIIRAFKGKTGK
jgi:site-specific recombinase XerD